MHVDTAIEHGSGVLANTRSDHGLATWVVLDEIRHVVDYASNSNETTTILALVNIIIPLHDGKLLKRNTPVEFGTLLIHLLLLLLQTTFLDLVAAELLEIVCETKLLARPDEPLGRVILMPFNGVTIVGWELVVEVVVALAKSHQGSNNMVARRVTVVEGLISKPVGQRVDAEGGLLNEEDAKDASVDEATKPITPAKTSHDRGEE